MKPTKLENVAAVKRAVRQHRKKHGPDAPYLFVAETNNPDEPVYLAVGGLWPVNDALEVQIALLQAKPK